MSLGSAGLQRAGAVGPSTSAQVVVLTALESSFDLAHAVALGHSADDFRDYAGNRKKRLGGDIVPHWITYRKLVRGQTMSD